MSIEGFASLNSDMLVRKGAAAPSVATMADVVRAPHLHPVSGDGALRRDVIRDDRATQRPGRSPVQQTRPGDEDMARVTVRLTHEQLRRLRLAAAVLDVSQQSLLSEAVASKLEALGRGPLKHCGCFHRSGQACGTKA